MSAGGAQAERAWLKRHRVAPRKRWGQNFLINPRIPAELIERWALTPATGVLEIGPGTGALTLPLLAGGQTVVAIERDPRLVELLRARVSEESAGGRLDLYEGDILAWDPSAILAAADLPDRWVMIGNLPYSITRPILEWAIRRAACFDWLALMVQREVAARLLAAPGSKTYGSPTLWVGYYFRVEKEMAVGAANFWPMPKVESVVLRLTPHAQPPVTVPSG